MVDPLFPDDDINAQHHKQQHDNQRAPCDDGPHPRFQIVPLPESVVAFKIALQDASVSNRQPCRHESEEQRCPLIFGGCEPAGVHNHRHELPHDVVPGERGRDRYHHVRHSELA